MAFLKKPLKWTALGQEPSELKKSEGFKMDESPAPGHFDFMFRSTYEAIEELQQKAGEVKTINNTLPNAAGNISVTKSTVGLSNVDNTSDANKPISNATKTELDKKYAKPTTGIPKTDLESSVQTALTKAESALQSVTKTDIGLGNVDNTSDANKPVSTAQQTALNLKANIASPTFTGTPKSTTAAAGTNTTQIATTAFVKTAVDNSATTINDSITTHKADLAHVHWIGTVTGTNALTATYEAITALKNGLGVAFLNTTSSTLATTLNINGLGAIPILKANGNPVTNLKANGIYTLRYANGNFIVQGEGGEYGNATASDVISGKTFGTENGLQTGTATIASLGGKRWASGVVSVGNPNGYLIEVRGLSFTPKTIIWWTIDKPGYSIGIFSKDIHETKYLQHAGIDNGNGGAVGGIIAGYVETFFGGFKVTPRGYEMKHGWIAYE